MGADDPGVVFELVAQQRDLEKRGVYLDLHGHDLLGEREISFGERIFLLEFLEQVVGAVLELGMVFFLLLVPLLLRDRAALGEVPALVHVAAQPLQLLIQAADRLIQHFGTFLKMALLALFQPVGVPADLLQIALKHFQLLIAFAQVFEI